MYKRATLRLKKILNAFHKEQLRQLTGKGYDNKITNQNVFKRCKELPILIDVL